MNTSIHGTCSTCNKPLDRVEARDSSHKCRISNLSMLKRAVQVGTRIEVLQHWQPQLAGMTRTANKVQGNGYWFERDGKRYWAPWPTAKEITFNADGSYTIQYGERGNATFRLA